MEDPLVVKVPTVADAMARRASAQEFEEPYRPSEGPQLACLPAFDADEDGIHVTLVAAGVRGCLLPMCARACCRAIDLFLRDVKFAQQIESFEPAVLVEAPVEEAVTEDLREIGGFGFYAENGKMYLHLHSIDTGRGVVFGPLTFGDEEEILKRLQTAFAKLPKDAVERSIVKKHIPRTRGMKLVLPWEHGERPPEVG